MAVPGSPTWPTQPKQTRHTLTLDSDPRDPRGSSDDGEVEHGDAALGPAGGGAPPAGDAASQEDPAGIGEAIGSARAAFARMLEAHMGLLKAELGVAGKELGIIVGLALAALTLAILILILLYVGSFLFFEEWLFGSMGWGMLHGTLLTGALIVGIVLNLAGGWMGAYGRGLLIGAGVTIALSLLFASNLLRQGAVAAGVEIEETIPLHPNLLPTLVGLVVGAAVGAVIAAAAAWRTDWRVQASVAGVVAGAFFGAILGSALFDNPGAVAISIVVGLLTWIIGAVWLAARRGFDPESRYALLLPRESIAAFEKTREFVTRQWERQKGRMMGR